MKTTRWSGVVKAKKLPGEGRGYAFYSYENGSGLKLYTYTDVSMWVRRVVDDLEESGRTVIVVTIEPRPSKDR